MKKRFEELIYEDGSLGYRTAYEDRQVRGEMDFDKTSADGKPLKVVGINDLEPDHEEFKRKMERSRFMKVEHIKGKEFVVREKSLDEQVKEKLITEAEAEKIEGERRKRGVR